MSVDIMSHHRTIAFTAINTQPMRIGDGDGNVLLDMDGRHAYIPATSINGALRAYVEKVHGPDRAAFIFGAHDLRTGESRESRVVLQDCSSLEPILYENRPGVSINGSTGAAESGGYFHREFAAPGNTFHFRLKIRGGKETIEKDTQIILTAVKAFGNRQIQLGGYKTGGAGAFEIRQGTVDSYDLSNPQDLLCYSRQQPCGREDLLTVLQGVQMKSSVVSMRFSGELTMPVLIKGEGPLQQNMPDAVNIRNAKEEPFIPGSSVKGLLRHHCNRIAGYLDVKGLVPVLFGNDKEERNNASASKVVFFDSVIQNPKEGPVYTRIKIDKYTGGVMGGALMQELPLGGELLIDMHYRLSESAPNRQDKACLALMNMALRDLACGTISLGSGEAIGRGRVRGKEIVWKVADETVKLDFQNNVVQGSDVVEDWMKALHLWKEEGLING